jgi:membrane peptidoglycan carboxypeptidase
MSSMMADDINARTGSRARELGLTLPAAGKTGTTNDFNDAWFVGFTPKLVAGVWVGFDQPRTILPNGFAADVAVPVWAKFMKVATAADKPEWFKTPADVTSATICRLSGKLATKGCEDVEVVGKNGELLRKSMVYTDTSIGAPSRPHTATSISTASWARWPGSSGLTSTPPRLTSRTPVCGKRARGRGGDHRRRRSPRSAGAGGKKKRGFWSKIFGKGKGDDQDQAGEEAPPKEERWLK